MRSEASASIPTGRLGVNILEGFAPIFFDAEGHGEGQEFFEHFGSLDHAIEAIGFDMSEKILEAENAFEGARAAVGSCGHEPGEGANDRAA